VRAKKRRKLNFGASLPVLSLCFRFLLSLSSLVPLALLAPLAPPTCPLPVLSLSAPSHSLRPFFPPANFATFFFVFFHLSLPRCTIIEFAEQ
jgi:hypothetical protein